MGSADKMNAVRFHGKEDLRYESIDVPAVGKGKIKVKPAWCGICGTDLHEYMGGPNLCPEEAPHPITGEKVPLTFGHEFAGKIEEIGEGTSGKFKVGDRVCVRPIIFDGDCGSCKDGLINCCDQNGFIGLSGWGGGLADHIVVPEYAVFKVPDNVGLDIAALVEPLAVGWHAVNLSPFKKGDSCLILGGGPIGLSVLQALRARGCDKILVSEVSNTRKQFAKDFGAHVIIDPSKEDIVSRCREECEGKGVNIAFDAAGVQVAMDSAVKAIRARGTLVNIAIWEKPANIYTNDFNFRERHYVGVATYMDGDFEEVLQALSDGRLDMCKKMITKRIKLDQVLEEGFKTLINDRDNHVKILVESSGET